MNTIFSFLYPQNPKLCLQNDINERLLYFYIDKQNFNLRGDRHMKHFKGLLCFHKILEAEIMLIKLNKTFSKCR